MSYSNRAATFSKIELPSAIERALQKQMTKYLDVMAITAFKTAYVCAIPTGEAAVTWDTDGTASTAAAVNVGYYHLEQIRDYMYSTLAIPPYAGDEYIGLLSTKACRGIKQDPKFEVWNKYTTPEAKAKGEIGKIEGIRIVEIGNTSVLSGTVGTGSVLGEGIIFGEDAVNMAVVQPPELRHAIPADFGRSMAVAWYGIINFGLIWSATATAGQARVVRITSS